MISKITNNSDSLILQTENCRESDLPKFSHSRQVEETTTWVL